MLARVLPLLASVFVLLAATVPNAVRAEERSIWIASGPQGGTYRDVYAKNLQDLLWQTNLLYRDTAGSEENIAMMQAGQADIAFAQADVFASAWKAGKTSGIRVVGRISDECVYIAYRKNGRVRRFDDLKKAPSEGPPLRISVGEAESGPAGSWRWFSQRIPELANVEIDDEFGTLALNQLALGRFDAVMWVTDPSNRGQIMHKSALANDALAIMNVTDPALLAPLADGTIVYQKRKVALTTGWRPKKIETICTSALLLMRRDADRALVERVSDVLSLNRAQIAAPDPE